MDNYLELTNDEMNAIKNYLGRGNVYMNLLFNDDLESIVDRLSYWLVKIENDSKIIDFDSIENTINLYAAMLKSYVNTLKNGHELPFYLYRGTTAGEHHSDGFKSFTAKQEMAEKFFNHKDKTSVLFQIKFPKDIVFIKPEDLYNYSFGNAERSEEEYLVSPFSILRKSEAPFIGFKRKNPYDVLEEVSIFYEGEDINIDEAFISSMNENIIQYAKHKRELELLNEKEQRFILNGWDTSDINNLTSVLFSNKQILADRYKKAHGTLMNFIKRKCAIKMTEIMGEVVPKKI